MEDSLEMTQTKEEKRILPVKEPIITTYTSHANLLAILGNTPETIEWIISHYILLYYNKRLDQHDWADFYFPHPYDMQAFQFCRWIQYEQVSAVDIRNRSEDIVQTLITWIEEGKYIDLYLNYYYISNNASKYHTNNFCHEVFIYGWNKSEKVFYCSDFLLSDSNKYTSSTISFEDVENAFRNCKGDEDLMVGINSIILLKLKKKISSHFNEEGIINSLRKYYRSEIPEYWQIYNTLDIPEMEFGLNGYHALLRKLEHLENDWLQKRTFYLMYDHKHLMIIRLNYLMGLHSVYEPYYAKLCEEYKGIEEKITAVIFLIVKYNVCMGNSRMRNGSKRIANIIKQMQEKLSEAEKQERVALQEFFDSIDQLNR